MIFLSINEGHRKIVVDHVRAVHQLRHISHTHTSVVWMVSCGLFHLALCSPRARSLFPFYPIRKYTILCVIFFHFKQFDVCFLFLVYTWIAIHRSLGQQNRQMDTPREMTIIMKRSFVLRFGFGIHCLLHFKSVVNLCCFLLVSVYPSVRSFDRPACYVCVFWVTFWNGVGFHFSLFSHHTLIASNVQAQIFNNVLLFVAIRCQHRKWAQTHTHSLSESKHFTKTRNTQRPTTGRMFRRNYFFLVLLVFAV